MHHTEVRRASVACGPADMPTGEILAVEEWNEPLGRLRDRTRHFHLVVVGDRCETVAAA